MKRIAIAVLCLLIGCRKLPPPPDTTVQPLPAATFPREEKETSRIVIAEHTYYEGKTILVLHDRSTGADYLAVCSDESERGGCGLVGLQ